MTSHRPGCRDGRQSSASFYKPVALAGDSNNVFVLEKGNAMVRVLHRCSLTGWRGEIASVAGKGRGYTSMSKPNVAWLQGLGVGSEDGPGNESRFFNPSDADYSMQLEALLIADAGNNMIRLVTIR